MTYRYRRHALPAIDATRFRQKLHPAEGKTPKSATTPSLVHSPWRGSRSLLGVQHLQDGIGWKVSVLCSSLRLVWSQRSLLHHPPRSACRTKVFGVDLSEQGTPRPPPYLNMATVTRVLHLSTSVYHRPRVSACTLQGTVVTSCLAIASCLLYRHRNTPRGKVRRLLRSRR